MDKIKLSDIDLSSMKKTENQGTKSTIYVKDDLCIKILDGLYPEEKQALYRKFLEMDGISIKDVILPIDLIVEDDKLQGYTMDYFKRAMPLSDYYSTRYVNCKDMFKAVKKASLILKEIHSNGIICQDLTFENILIDENGTIKFCDIDGCAYNENIVPFLSVLLKRFMIDYRKEKLCIVSKNMDRISMMLAFYLLTYFKELQRLSKKEYHTLSDHITTLENSRSYANILVNRGSYIPYIPYMDELIDDNDDYVIDRDKQISLVRKIFRR